MCFVHLDIAIDFTAIMTPGNEGMTHHAPALVCAYLSGADGAHQGSVAKVQEPSTFIRWRKGSVWVLEKPIVVDDTTLHSYRRGLVRQRGLEGNLTAFHFKFVNCITTKYLSKLWIY